MIQHPATLARSLDHVFKAPGLFQQALTHRSAGTPHNERLEYLGDAVLGLVVADLLYQAFPHADEGMLSRLRAKLVKQESLANIARELRLGDYLILGSGELRTGGHARDSILSDALEAIFGAIYLDAGLTAAQQVIQRLFNPRIRQLDSQDCQKDPKTRLQEYLQGQQHPLPEYRLIATSGEPHAQTFQVCCSLSTLGLTREGSGTSRRRAEQAAARAVLEVLEPQENTA